jgi:hypothetical protein
LVTALAACDYLLWNLSSEGKSAVLALVSGLALVPLLLALIWLVLLALTRVLITRSKVQAPQATMDVAGRSAAPERVAAARGTLTARSRLAISLPARREALASGRLRVAAWPARKRAQPAPRTAAMLRHSPERTTQDHADSDELAA